MTDQIEIRPACDADADFVAGLASSLLEFGSVSWKEPEALVPGLRKVLVDAVRNQDPRSAVLIAQGEDGAPVGFISMKTGKDVAGNDRAHVADLAVAERARRGGVGRALMGAAEQWAREHEFDVISLDVWSTNDTALQFYRRLGYDAESLCLIKALD